MDNWVPRPRGKQLNVLLSALRKTGINIKGSSFDAVSIPDKENIDFTNEDMVNAFLPAMTFIEIKTSNQDRVKDDFSGFFFALTESEISASEALGDRHKVALYNKKTGDIFLTSIPEILERSKSTNWQVSVQL